MFLFEKEFSLRLCREISKEYSKFKSVVNCWCILYLFGIILLEPYQHTALVKALPGISLRTDFLFIKTNLASRQSRNVSVKRGD